MDREVTGCGNLLLDEKRRKIDYRQHKKRVTEARLRGDPHLKNVIDAERNSGGPFINNAKAVQMDEERV